jgi:hypothetical protein
VCRCLASAILSKLRKRPPKFESAQRYSLHNVVFTTVSFKILSVFHHDWISVSSSSSYCCPLKSSDTALLRDC